MRQVSSSDVLYDRVERLLDVAAANLNQDTLNHWLTRLGQKPQNGLLATYHSLRSALLSEPANIDLVKTELEATLAEQKNHVEPLFERAFFVFGIRRAGNHALVNWLRDHFCETETVVINSADLAFYETSGSNFSLDFGKYNHLRKEKKQSVLIVSYENLDPILFPLAHNAKIAGNSQALILLRDFPNQAASIARSAFDSPSFAFRYRVRDFPDLWCRFANHHLTPPRGWKSVSYNSWCKSESYRSELQVRLGIPRRDVRTNSVSAVGGGSSFDATKHDGQAEQMHVLERWKQMTDDRLFQFLMLAEEEALRLNHNLFEMEIPERAYWLAKWVGT